MSTVAAPAATGIAGAASGSRFAESQEWTRRGAQIIAEKKRAEQSLQPQSPVGVQSSVESADHGDAAYLSLAVDILADGDYALLFPVPNTYSVEPAGKGPMSWAFTYPDDLDFTIHPNGDFTLRPAPNGGKYLVVPMRASGVKAPYRHFSVWTY